jgi:cytochrome c556
MNNRNAATWLLGSLALFGALWCATPPAPARAQPPADAYAPSAPPEAYQAALRTNLKIVADWIDQGDFSSANKSHQLVTTLVQLYGLRSNDDKHKESAAALKTATDKVTAAIRMKNTEVGKKAVAECTDAIAALTKAPAGEKAVHKNFRSFGGTGTWMLLMDGSIIDAKDTKSVEEFQHLALALAEEASVMSFIRPEANWRKFADETRSAALKAAEAAKKDGLAAGRTELKAVTQTCEACHKGYKR